MISGPRRGRSRYRDRAGRSLAESAGWVELARRYRGPEGQPDDRAHDAPSRKRMKSSPATSECCATVFTITSLIGARLMISLAAQFVPADDYRALSGDAKVGQTSKPLFRFSNFCHALPATKVGFAARMPSQQTPHLGALATLSLTHASNPSRVDLEQ